MAGLQAHKAAFDALRQAPGNPQAARLCYDLALSDPPGARAALEEATCHENLARRFIRAAPLPSVEDVALRSRRSADQREPKTLAELRALMAQAASEGRSLRAVGAGYNFTNIDDTDGYSIRMSPHLRSILTLDTGVLRNVPAAENLVEFEAGATIEALTDHLWRQESPKSLLNQPGYELLTFIGVASCGGHGSGVRLAPIADAIQSLRILTFDGNHDILVRQVENAQGITDRSAFEAKYPDIELIQDDAFFSAAKVSMGTFGIVYSAIIEVQPAFFLREDRVLRPWDEVKAALPAMLADPDLHSLHVWLNPYPVDGAQSCVTSEYRLANGPPHGERGRGIRFGGIQAIIDVMLWIARHFPDSTPGLVNAAIEATAATDVVMPSWEALNFGPPNRLRSLGIDYGVDLQAAVPAADALSRALQERGRTERSFVLSPLGIRFCSRSDAFMAPSFGRDTCMIELPLLEGLSRRDDFVATYAKAVEPFQARPHWGQLNLLDGASARRLYPRFEEFKAVFKSMNVSGLFDNAFTRQLEL